MSNRIILKNGTEIFGALASRSSDNHLMVRIPGENILDDAILFGNHENTETIICYFSIYKITYTGYTDMYSIQYFAEENYVEIWLKPAEGVETSIDKEITVPREYLPVDLYSEESIMSEEEEETENVGEHDDSGEN